MIAIITALKFLTPTNHIAILFEILLIILLLDVAESGSIRYFILKISYLFVNVFLIVYVFFPLPVINDRISFANCGNNSNALPTNLNGVWFDLSPGSIDAFLFSSSP